MVDMSVAKNLPTLRLGIVGLGVAGSMMVMNLRHHAGVRLVAACDLNPSALDSFAADFGAFITSDLSELLALPGLDAVYIATPHQLHRQQAIQAAEAGIHIIVEKPLALTLSDCDQIIEAVSANGVQLVVGHTHSFDPAVAKMAAVIASGEIGPLQMINSWNYTNFLYRPRRPEELDTALGGGIIFNQVPHQIDSLRLLAASEVISVRAATGIWDSDRPTEGAYQAFISFENGVTATVVYSGYDHFDSDELHHWIGEGGREKPAGGWGSLRSRLAGVESAVAESALRQQSGYGAPPPAALGVGAAHQPHFGITIASCAGGDLRGSADGIYCYSAAGREEFTLASAGVTNPAIPGWCEVVDELRSAITGDRPALHDGRWGKQTLAVCLAILESAASRQEVYL